MLAGLHSSGKISTWLNWPHGKPNQKPVNIAPQAVEQAVKTGKDVLLFDTAGWLHIDDELMAELEAIKAKVHPRNTTGC